MKPSLNNSLNIGYACIALGVPGAQLKTCRLNSATGDVLTGLTAHNVNALEAMLTYNIGEGIRLFRISSELIPFASHPDVRFPWRELFAARLTTLGGMIRESGMRVSMHPGQYTLLNAKDAGVTARSIEDIRYHAALLDALETDHTHKIVLHLGGVYGDKTQAVRRFKDHFKNLDPAVRRRIVLENDDRQFHIADVLETATALGIPAVFDNLHHRVNSCGGTDAQWIEACRPTWDSRQKIHYSQQAAGKKPGAHSAAIRVREFLVFRDNLPYSDIDVMLEVKDKNLSAIKCALCTAERREMSRIEAEWGRYEYAVLERDPAAYARIRGLLKDKSAYPAEEFYDIVEQALGMPFNAGHARNAAQRVWGFFKEVATEMEKRRFLMLIEDFDEGKARRAKAFFRKLTEKYQISALCGAYFLLETDAT